MSVNKAIIIGRLGNDPDLKDTRNGGQIANLSVATSETWKDKSGEKQERTEWHRVVIFNENLAKLAGQYLGKGDQVYLEGSIRTRKYEKDGIEKYTTEVVLGQFDGVMRFLAKAGEKGEGGARPQPKASKPAPEPEALSDEIPF
jgi:single-strand DNA-binding protein